MTLQNSVVVLCAVDDTLLDNDAAEGAYKVRIVQHCGPQAADRYWVIAGALRADLSHVDYLDAPQHYRLEHLHDPRLLLMSSFLLDYPFAELLYSHALDALAHISAWGPTVILSDGDAVFQPRKVERSGLRAAVAATC